MARAHDVFKTDRRHIRPEWQLRAPERSTSYGRWAPEVDPQPPLGALTRPAAMQGQPSFRRERRAQRLRTRSPSIPALQARAGTEMLS